MNRNFVISVVAMFVLSMGFGFLIHGTILHGEYAKLPNLMRTEAEAQKLFGLMFLANFMIALGFSWIYIKGKEARPWLGQGFRYGVAGAGMMRIPLVFLFFAVMSFPSSIGARQTASD